jgi:hypothetical protein
MLRSRSFLITAALPATSMAGCTGYNLSGSASTQSLEAPREAAIATFHSSALRPPALWHAENPPSCGSPRFEQAGAAVLKVAILLTPEQSGVDAVSDGGSWILEAADDARHHGCKGMAQRLYDSVIEIYVGGNYAALWQRAQISINDLRQ